MLGIRNIFRSGAAIVIISCGLATAANPLINKLMMSTDALPQQETVIINEGKSQLNSVLDNSIVEETYMVGGGDGFLISFVGKPSISYDGVIDQNGHLFIPDIGLIEIGKISLREAKDTIEGFFERNTTKGTTVYVSLTNIQNATDYKHGTVSSPGRRVFPGTMRLLDALKVANDALLPPIETCDYRTIKCGCADSLAHYDLLRYMLTGDLSQNPYVYPGDNIYLDRTRKRVLISGPISNKTTGLVPIKEGETAGDLLALFKFDASADTMAFLLQSGPPGEQKRMTTVRFQDAGNHPLHDKDAITILTKDDYPEILTALVTGEAARPGIYPVVKDQMTVESLIQIAGGATTHGDLKRTVIVRGAKRFGKESMMALEERMALESLFRPDLENASVAMLTKQMSVCNDFTVISLEENPDVIIEDADMVYIPPIEHYVYVGGGVRNPGGYLYSDGKSTSHYLRQAGGLTRNSDKKNMYVIRRFGDVTQITDGKTILPGDVIMVPMIPRYRDLITIVLPIISAAATLASIILALYATMAR